ncbi:MAG: hypothetical protein JWM57_2121 [Phycisphaerales bacterium]|nr:hypothetical protein [Phycisphaerales bacterium]
MSVADAQKSEVHAATADASTSPSAAGDAETTRPTGHGKAPADPNPRNPVGPVDLTIVKDETDAGGPLVIITADPALNPPRVPSDPFPTNGTPEIDPPVKK